MTRNPLQQPEPYGSDRIPASGGWFAGDPVGKRKFLTFGVGEEGGRPFALEGGGQLKQVTVCYETWGELNVDCSNAVLVCHPVTGDSHAAGDSGPGHQTPGWWEPLIGSGQPFDTDHLFVVCVNVLGGCQGSTGPNSPHPDDGKPYGPRFPVVSIRDMVRTQKALADHLQINRWQSVVGGSMGGMQALEWAVMFPEQVGSLVVIASAAAASPLQIGWSEVGRLAVVQDPKWAGGFYYDASAGEGPHEGLMLARRVAMLHYRTDDSLQFRFGRSTVGQASRFEMWSRFQVESYLDYQGQKLARRFDANSYLALNKAMDLHDVGRGRAGVQAALCRVAAPTLVVSVNSDYIYPPRQQEELRDGLVEAGADVTYEVLESQHGHDGFLIEYEQLGPMVHTFLVKQADAS